MKEKELQEVTRLALVQLKMFGKVAEFFHPFNSFRSQPGYPDWTICFSQKDQYGKWMSEVIWIELKSEKGKLSEYQKRWQRAIGERYHVARSLEEFFNVLERYGILK